VKVVFITRGGLEMGMGHVSRSITLAKELKNDTDVLFLINADDTVMQQIVSAGFKAEFCVDEQLLNRLEKINPDIVIIDRLKVEESFAGSLKNALKAKLVIFGNTTKANDYADIVVNAVVGSKFISRMYQDRNTLYFCGPKYYVLRNDFYAFQKLGKKTPPIVNNILLIFGGSDPSNLTTLTLSELLNSDRNYNLDVILGAHFSFREELDHLLIQYQGKKNPINIYSNINNVAELMYKADLVITSPGVSFFESLCVGTQVISVNQNSLQESWMEGSLSSLNKHEISKISFLITNFDFINPNSEFIRRLEIGEGKTDLVNNILKARGN